MASLFKASGLYYLDFFDRNQRPKRKRVALKVRDKRTADQLRIKYEGDYAQGLFDPWAPPPEPEPEAEPDLTLSVAIARFLQAKRDADKTENTLRAYRAVLSLLSGRIGKELPLEDIRPDQLRAFVRDETVSATTNRNPTPARPGRRPLVACSGPSGDGPPERGQPSPETGPGSPRR